MNSLSSNFFSLTYLSINKKSYLILSIDGIGPFIQGWPITSVIVGLSKGLNYSIPYIRYLKSSLKNYSPSATF